MRVGKQMGEVEIGQRRAANRRGGCVAAGRVLAGALPTLRREWARDRYHGHACLLI